VAQQVQPDAAVLLSQADAARVLARAQSALAQASPARRCWLGPVLDDTQVQAVQAQLQSDWAPAEYAWEPATVPGRWLVYMGKFTSPADLGKKRSQLVALKVPFDTVRNPALAPGLSLGVFSSEDQAQQALAELAPKGVRSARVVQDRPPAPGQRLRIPAADEAAAPRLAALRAVLPGKTLTPCTP